MTAQAERVIGRKTRSTPCGKSSLSPVDHVPPFLRAPAVSDDLRVAQNNVRRKNAPPSLESADREHEEGFTKPLKQHRSPRGGVLAPPSRLLSRLRLLTAYYSRTVRARASSVAGVRVASLSAATGAVGVPLGAVGHCR